MPRFALHAQGKKAKVTDLPHRDHWEMVIDVGFNMKDEIVTDAVNPQTTTQYCTSSFQYNWKKHIHE